MANGHGGAREGSGRKPGTVPETLLAKRRELKDMLENEAMVELAVKKLKDILNDKKNGMAQLAAIQTVFERFAGRPIQPIDIAPPDPGMMVMMRYMELLRNMEPDERAQLRETLRRVASQPLLPAPHAGGDRAA